MSRKKSGTPLIKKNLSFPSDFEERFNRLRRHLGATSDSEVIRMAIVQFEAKLGLPPMPFVIDAMRKKK